MSQELSWALQVLRFWLEVLMLLRFYHEFEGWAKILIIIEGFLKGLLRDSSLAKNEEVD